MGSIIHANQTYLKRLMRNGDKMKIFIRGSFKRHLKLKGWVNCTIHKFKGGTLLVKLEDGNIIKANLSRVLF